MKKKDLKKRAAPYSYRPPKELREEFARRVKDSGLPVSTFITKAWHGQTIKGQKKAQPEQIKLEAKILHKAGKIADELHEIQLAQRGYQSLALLLEQALDELVLIRSALMKQMGRKP